MPQASRWWDPLCREGRQVTRHVSTNYSQATASLSLAESYFVGEQIYCIFIANNLLTHLWLSAEQAVFFTLLSLGWQNDSIEIFFKIKGREDSEVGWVEYGNRAKQILWDYYDNLRFFYNAPFIFPHSSYKNWLVLVQILFAWQQHFKYFFKKRKKLKYFLCWSMHYIYI